MSSHPKIKVLIVDDMPAVRENLRLLLQMEDNIEIIGETGDVDSARKIIFKYRPHLVFLDINLPEKSGFDLLDELKELPEINMDVLFVTAHSEHAVKAFEYYPFNFLVKPVEREKLSSLLKKYAELKFVPNFRERADKLKQIYGKLHFKGQNGHLWLEAGDILWCKAERNYTEIFLKQGATELVSEKIGAIQNMLPNNIFLKSHRSYIVNTKQIRKINKRSGKIILNDNLYSESPLVSKDKIQELIKMLNG